MSEDEKMVSSAEAVLQTNFIFSILWPLVMVMVWFGVFSTGSG